MSSKKTIFAVEAVLDHESKLDNTEGFSGYLTDYHGVSELLRNLGRVVVYGSEEVLSIIKKIPFSAGEVFLYHHYSDHGGTTANQRTIANTVGLMILNDHEAVVVLHDQFSKKIEDLITDFKEYDLSQICDQSGTLAMS